MPFIHRHQVSEEIRRDKDASFKALLRQALSNPGLTAEQRQSIKVQLAEVGQPVKVYRADSPPKPGAISFEPNSGG